jgi:hypothetical protein
MHAGGTPSLELFLQEASRCARIFGLQLRQQDEAVGNRGIDRRWIGWPVGHDEKKTTARFQSSFLFARSGPWIRGPLAELGLACEETERVYPTELGLRLGAAHSALLGETAGGLLSPEQRELLRTAVLANGGERAEIASYIRGLRTNPLGLTRIDNAFESLHPGWSENQLTAHKAALFGRLRDLGVVDIDSSSTSPHVIVVPEARQFVEQVFAAQEGRWESGARP